ncbi:DnaJ domain-containing protein [Ephemerocybe angulata]|uniref:DnaJ domain-containing protein n=1 Tax=Ephemerocybe angulata TaxID=980116 RepID=A0A8H6MFI6_9AGAR|nr:DnaJ domain-containing protein [Tulosesus angulatus]
MKLFSLLFGILAVLATTVLAYEDHEIFDLVSELEAAEGKGTTFYSWLDVPSTASTADIAKAYRKKSMVLHPDKNAGVKGIQERFARLGVISAILRNKEKRERYDFFYKNGVPKWRGTGYYYARFRPGLGFVFSFLIIVTSGLQYMVQGFNYKKDLARIEQITGKAKAAAWGPKMVPIAGKRKVRVNLGEARDEDGNVLDNRWIDMVVNGEDVYFLEPNGDQVLIDSSTATPAAITRTWFISLLASLALKVTGKKAAKGAEEVDEGDDAPTVDRDSDDSSSVAGSDGPGSGTSTPGGAVKSGHAATSKAGGKRRKAVKRR